MKQYSLSMRVARTLIDILKNFTYLGSAVHNDGGSRQEVTRRIGLTHSVMDSLSLNMSIWRCQYLCRQTKIRIFKSLVIPVLLYGCETCYEGTVRDGSLLSPFVREGTRCYLCVSGVAYNR